MSQSPPATTLPILWGSFVVTHTLFAGLSFAIPPEPMAATSWVPLLGLVALVPAGLSTQAGLFAKAVGNVQSWFILRFALAEVAAILGFVSWFVTGEHVVQLGCAAVGLLAHLLAFPTPGAIATYQASRG